MIYLNIISFIMYITDAILVGPVILFQNLFQNTLPLKVWWNSGDEKTGDIERSGGGF